MGEYGREQISAYLGEIDTQSRRFVLVDMFTLAVTITGYLVYTDLLVPTSYSQNVGSGGKGKIGDCILRRVGDSNIVLEITDRVASGGGRRGSKQSCHLGRNLLSCICMV